MKRYRNESKELKVMRSLGARMDLCEVDRNYLLSLKKGFEGECKFDGLIEPYLDGRIVLNDLLLAHKNTVFQNDSLVMSSSKIVLFEVKNLEGDYYLEGDSWFSSNDKEITNPLHQLNRSTILLRHLLKGLGIFLPIEPYLVFVNPEFYLYQAPTNLPIIFLPQLNRYFTKMQKERSILKDHHYEIGKQLLSLELTDAPSFRLPKYDYPLMKKGIPCLACGGMYGALVRTTLVCKNCGFGEDYESAVVRSVEEFQLLFPAEKITTTTMIEWCDIISTKKAMRKILSKNFDLIKSGKMSHYVKEQQR
ncbi:nuclease-related domain-containing protein [Pseudalkalibacillus sp. Hm43]|uniref:nuclease-related domain-containing protein n=1 Tax=Pseudalkalibacillus sp. Hm43 TaxID=3450742 RepID=UPI003F437ADD